MKPDSHASPDLTSHHSQTYSSLEQYIQGVRFLDTDVLSTVEQEVDLCLDSSSSVSRLILVHSPFAADDARSQGLLSQDTTTDHSSGEGCGKSDLLSLMETKLRQQVDCLVLSFAENSKRLIDGQNFYKQVFLPTLEESYPRLTRPVSMRLRVVLQATRGTLRRSQLLVTEAVPPFVAVVAYVLTLLGFRALEFAADPSNQSLFRRIATFTTENRLPFYGLGAIALAAWLLYAWRAIRGDEELFSRWRSYAESPDIAELVSSRRLRLIENPGKMLEFLYRQKSTVAILIDDVDVLDGFSFELLMKLYDEAKTLRGCSMVMLLSHNPRNPTLGRPDKRGIVRTVESMRYGDKEATLVSLRSPGPEELQAWLRGYYGTPHVLNLLDVLRRDYQDETADVGSLIPFFKRFDRLIAKEGISVEDVGEETLTVEFEKYLHRDRRKAQDIISAIAAATNAVEETLEVLKYILAFKKTKIRVVNLEAVIRKAGLGHVADYEDALLSEDAGLLRRGSEHHFTLYVYRQPYLRSLLDAGWSEWREGAKEYYTTVFEGLHERTGVKEEPELALEARESKLAVSVLYGEGEHYYKYSGSINAGYALRFYGLEGGGALQKWISLCHQRIESGEDLWDLMEWMSQVRRNPLRGYSRKIHPRQMMAHELVLTAGRLYWMIGRWEVAYDVWTYHWPYILEHLSQTSDERLARRLNQADSEIRASLAEMIYEVGDAEHWEEARRLCLHLRDQKMASAKARERASLVLALIQHYRQFGVGNELPPYRFLRPDVELGRLEDLCNSLPPNTPDRLRALYTWAEALWQVLLPPPLTLPAEMNFDRIVRCEVEDSLVDAFEGVMREYEQTLDKLSAVHSAQKGRVLSQGRVHEGDLILGEGVLLFLQSRFLALKAQVWFGRYHLTLRERRESKAMQRFNTYLEGMRELEANLLKALRGHRAPKSFSRGMETLQGIAAKNLASNDDLGPDDERRARAITQNLYRVAWKSLVQTARDRLRIAATLYGHLGHEQGVARVTFVRALLTHSFAEDGQLVGIESGPRTPVKSHPLQKEHGIGQANWVVASPPEPPSYKHEPLWVSQCESAVRLCNGEIGYNLDLLRIHLLVGRWAATRDPYRGVLCFLEALEWAWPEWLGLPEILAGEISFQTGHLMGTSTGDDPFPDSFVYETFDRTAHIFDTLDAALPYLEEETLAHRRLTVHWWLAEVCSRRASAEQSYPELRDEWIKRSLDHCQYVIDQSEAVKDSSAQRNLSRLVKGGILVLEGRFVDGFTEVERALDAFTDAGDHLNQLQALTSLVRWGRHSNDAPGWKECQDRAFTSYWRLLLEVAAFQLRGLDESSPANRLVLSRAGQLIGELLACQSEESARRRALAWLNQVFIIYRSLGMHGSAILLDRKIRPLLEQLEDSEGLEEHRERVLETARDLDPSREKIRLSRIGSILRELADVLYEPANIDSIPTKRDCVRAAAKALRFEPPDLSSATHLLERARQLIDYGDAQDVDADVLELLSDVYYRRGDFERGIEIDGQLARIESTIQGRDFLDLAEHCKRNGWEYMWALKIARDVPVENEYSRRASIEWLSDQAETKWSDPSPSALSGEPLAHVESEEEHAQDHEHLVTLPSGELDMIDCIKLLRFLEKEIRSLILTDLSKLTPKWWKQRVPVDVRRKAEAVKRKTERPYPGRTQQDLPLVQYLDFSDYTKIITMTPNWNDAFKSVFGTRDFVFIKFGEIQTARNAMAHNRQLDRHDRELFVTNAKQILRALTEHRDENVMASEQTEPVSAN